MNETELLFTELLNCSRLSLYLNERFYLDKDISEVISSVLKKRLSGEPIQYILGKTEFMGLEFKVNKYVFIPRPETEILVETAIKYASGFRSQVSGVNILDIGTGSGCIAISLAEFLHNFKIDAVDISEEALNIAGENAKIHGVSERVNFLRSNLFESLQLYAKRYTMIVCNPPYIRTKDIDNLSPQIQYEPRIALDGGKDGLDFYKKIIRAAPNYLIPDGLLLLELGFNQLSAVKNIFSEYKNFRTLELIKDYNNVDRVIVARKADSLKSDSR